MYSDDWLAKGWASDPPTRLHDAVDYRFWRDEQGDVIGLGVDFEWSGDVHYEIAGRALLKLLKVLGVGDGEDVRGPLSDVTHFSLDLEDLLRGNDIPFMKDSYR